MSLDAALHALRNSYAEILHDAVHHAQGSARTPQSVSHREIVGALFGARSDFFRGHAAIWAGIAKQVNELSTVTRLPPEVLCEIFGWLNLKDRISVSRVSTSWRQVTLESPRIWADITLNLFDNMACLPVLAGRSKQALIDLTAVRGAPDLSRMEYFFSRNADRLRRVTVSVIAYAPNSSETDWTTSAIHPEGGLQLTLPHSKALKVLDVRCASNLGAIRLHLPSSLPALQTMTLHNIYNVRHLDFPAYTDLRRLKVQCSLGAHGVMSLSNLRIILDECLSLRELHLAGLMQGTINFDEALPHLPLRRRAPLDSLILNGCFMAGEMAMLLELLPTKSIRSLVVQYSCKDRSEAAVSDASPFLPILDDLQGPVRLYLTLHDDAHQGLNQNEPLDEWRDCQAYKVGATDGRGYHRELTHVDNVATAFTPDFLFKVQTLTCNARAWFVSLACSPRIRFPSLEEVCLMSRTFNPLDDGYVIKGHSSSGAVDVLTEVQPCHPSERVVLDSKPVTPKCRNLQSLVISYTQRSRELFGLPLLEQLKWAALGKCDTNRPGMIAFIGPLPTRDPEVLADCDESGAVFHDTGVRDEDDDDDYDDMTP